MGHGFFFCIFYFLLFQCALRHQPLHLKYFFVFKLGSCHFPRKRSIQEEKSEFVHYFSRLPATCRDFILTLCSGPAWFGLVFFFGRCLQAPWRIGRPPGGRGDGTHRRFRKEKQSSCAPQQPSLPPYSSTSPSPGEACPPGTIACARSWDGTGQWSQASFSLSCFIPSSAENLKAVLAESCCSIEGAKEEKVDFLFYSCSLTFRFSSFSSTPFAHPIPPPLKQTNKKNTHTPKKKKKKKSSEGDPFLDHWNNCYSKGSLKHLPAAPLGDRC